MAVLFDAPGDGGAGAGDLIKSGTDQSFMADVIEASKTQPVLVDFWAPWCGPCRQLTPALERAVTAAKGKVKLVKVNIDENPAVAGQLGVRSIPAVFAFDKGRPVDGFMGALPESQVRMFIERLAGGGAGAGADVDTLISQAQDSFTLGDMGGAAQGFAEALQLDPENVKAIAGLARCYLAAGDAERARGALALAPEDKAKAAELESVRAALELSAEDAPDPAPLQQKVDKTPGDHAARYDLARALAARGELEPAVDHLMTILERQRDWNEDAARKYLLKIFDAAGPTSAVARNGRRRLSALLFS